MKEIDSRIWEQTYGIINLEHEKIVDYKLGAILYEEKFKIWAIDNRLNVRNCIKEACKDEI